MFLKLLTIFIIIPILELVLLIKLGELIGIFYTILIIFSTGVIGVWLAKNQGFIVLSKFRDSMNSGFLPGDSIVDGILILIGSAVLLTPGLITDFIGFLMLIPYTRILIREFFKKRLKFYLENGYIKIII
jgi:UPF0716 protein FxsA